MILTDFSLVSKLLLAYPENFQNEYEELVPFYDLLLTKIPYNISLFIIVNNECSKNKLTKQIKNRECKIILEKEWNEVWVRDVFGLPLINNRICKTTYSPNYCGYLSKTRDFEKLNYLATKIIERQLNQEIIYLPLILDGGNFVSNGKLAILTDKILKDNNKDKVEIESILNKTTHCYPIIVPACPGDNVGHSDGYTSFINENTVCLSKYPSDQIYEHDSAWLNMLEIQLRPYRLEIIPFFERPSCYYIPCQCEERRRRNCCTMTANGGYVNFLRLNSTILLPEYSLPNLREILYFNSINELHLSSLGFQVIKINCDSIASQGAVLRCLSFTL